MKAEDFLLPDPTEIPAQSIAPMITRLSSWQSALAARLLGTPVTASPQDSKPEGESEFRSFLTNIDEDLQPVIECAYLTGWRIKSEVLPLKWGLNVDMGAGEVRLEPGTTKNDEGRVFPFSMLPELAEMIARQKRRTQSIERSTGQIVHYEDCSPLHQQTPNPAATRRLLRIHLLSSCCSTRTTEASGRLPHKNSHSRIGLQRRRYDYSSVGETYRSEFCYYYFGH